MNSKQKQFPVHFRQNHVLLKHSKFSNCFPRQFLTRVHWSVADAEGSGALRSYQHKRRLLKLGWRPPIHDQIVFRVCPSRPKLWIRVWWHRRRCIYPVTLCCFPKKKQDDIIPIWTESVSRTYSVNLIPEWVCWQTTWDLEKATLERR